MLTLHMRHDIGWHRPAFDGVHLQDCAKRVLVQIHHVACGIRGHDLALALEPHHLSLQCMNCGWKSPGWWIAPRRASVSGQHLVQGLAQPQLSAR
jgi:hypothetical protein